jgi:hypothetical protein
VVFRHPSEKYEFVTWDDDIPNIWKVWKVIKFMFQTTNQIIISDEKDYIALLTLSNPAQPPKIIQQLSLWDIQQPRIDKEQTEDDRAHLGSTNAASAERVAVCFFLWWVPMGFKRLKPISVEDGFFFKNGAIGSSISNQVEKYG